MSIAIYYTFGECFIDTNLQHCSRIHKLYKREALRERRPPWPGADHTPILPTVKMLRLDSERLTPPPPPPSKKKKKKKSFGSLPAPRSGYATTIMVFFCLLILEFPDHHQNLISSSLYYPGPLHKISSQSVLNFLSNVVHIQRDKQTTNRQTNATKNITSFAKVTINSVCVVTYLLVNRCLCHLYWDENHQFSCCRIFTHAHDRKLINGPPFMLQL